MAPKRKPTLKQLFALWKKYQKKRDEYYKIKRELDSMAGETPYNSELINDGEYVYRVCSKARYGFYEVDQVATVTELKKLQ